ncbi:MAG: phage tail protein [Bacteroidetes bacterium]|nr:phage tail protein [Rhodothermaceae bacterium RA]RMH63621.1 MAG: phage tail protein [Bacteroidota bacterium]
MADARPFTAFNFLVELLLDGENKPLCNAGFSACDGLELTMQPKTYQEGGNNTTQIHRAGPLSYGMLTLKRGMTDSFELWTWFSRFSNGEYALRATGVVVLLSADRRGEQARFVLTRCLPVKLRAPSLNAQDGLLAIEELQIAYERLHLETP